MSYPLTIICDLLVFVLCILCNFHDNFDRQLDTLLSLQSVRDTEPLGFPNDRSKQNKVLQRAHFKGRQKRTVAWWINVHCVTQ